MTSFIALLYPLMSYFATCEIEQRQDFVHGRLCIHGSCILSEIAGRSTLESVDGIPEPSLVLRKS